MANRTKVDHIIVGLGLSGAAMALQLIKLGKTIAAFDVPQNNRSSRVAAGLFNPVSGKLMAKTWNADLLFPYLDRFYRDAEAVTGHHFFHPSPIYIPFRSVEEQNDWVAKTSDPSIASYVQHVYTSTKFGDQVYDDLGGIVLTNSGYINVNSYLRAVRDLIKTRFVLREEMQHEKLSIEKDHVAYNDIVADSIIMCEGLHALNHTLTNWLPLWPLKGETIEVRFDQPMQMIYNRGVYAVPAADRYVVGATYERTASTGTTENGRRDLELRLQSLLRISYEVTGQQWGIRPTTRDRRPLLGRHPDYDSVFIFNGMGTKGVSQAPYFSNLLSEAVTGGSQIAQVVNITRF